MDTTKHNHPPRCCCPPGPIQPLGEPPEGPDECPLCPEHGELAQLGRIDVHELSANLDPNPFTEAAGIPSIEPTDAAHDAAVAAALASTRLPGPCPSCHQLPGRPPTEYCETPNRHETQP